MAPYRLGTVVLIGLMAGPVFADCPAGSLVATPFEFNAIPPAPPDPGLRPVLPECLRGLTGPEQENCPREEIAAYGAAVETWVAALNSHVTDTSRFANEAVSFANSVIDYANRAQAYSDTALKFANCEVEVIYAVPEN